MHTRKQTCCFTGHRPEKLPWGTNEADDRCRILKSKLREAIHLAYDMGLRHFICGMARGCDLYFAEEVLALQARGAEITLEAAIPYPAQAAHWSEPDRSRWQAVVDACDLETVVQSHYSRSCMLRRDKYMVDHSALLIAVFSGERGGTSYTIDYAIKQRLSIIDIPPL